MDNDRQTKDLRSPCVLALRTGIAEFESAGSWLRKHIYVLAFSLPMSRQLWMLMEIWLW